MLDALHYEVKVPAGEYAKYYFHLRSMIARLGYHRRRKSELLPLNINGAKKLQLATEEYANTKLIDADSQGKVVTYDLCHCVVCIIMLCISSVPVAKFDCYAPIGGILTQCLFRRRNPQSGSHYGQWCSSSSLSSD